MKYCKNCHDMEKCEMHGGCWNPPAKEKPLSPSDATDCSDFWGCVAASVDSITKALPELYQADGYARIELTKQLDRLVDIMERSAYPMMKIDGQNATV